MAMQFKEPAPETITKLCYMCFRQEPEVELEWLGTGYLCIDRVDCYEYLRIKALEPVGSSCGDCGPGIGQCDCGCTCGVSK
jgi:hypothetical protein